MESHSSRTKLRNYKKKKGIKMGTIIATGLTLYLPQHWLRVCLDTAYCWKLKTKNWKHYNKIIFKCVNSVVGPSFKVFLVEKITYGSHEQCIGPTVF